MDTILLLKKLQSEAKLFSIEEIEELLKTSEEKMLNNAEIFNIHKLSLYNLQNFLELKKTISLNSSVSVDPDSVEEMENSLNKYLDIYSQNQEKFNAYIRITSVYLTFIAKKPLHPPDMFFNNQAFINKEGIFTCPIRREQIKQTDSLCRFCVSSS